MIEENQEVEQAVQEPKELKVEAPFEVSQPSLKDLAEIGWDGYKDHKKGYIFAVTRGLLSTARLIRTGACYPEIFHEAFEEVRNVKTLISLIASAPEEERRKWFAKFVYYYLDSPTLHAKSATQYLGEQLVKYGNEGTIIVFLDESSKGVTKDLKYRLVKKIFAILLKKKFLNDVDREIFGSIHSLSYITQGTKNIIARAIVSAQDSYAAHKFILYNRKYPKKYKKQLKALAKRRFD
ncbi:MAG: hypothetical protein HYW78_03400 [Parcubacteria group bacterium]|nr:hypothetical protein [Parcubacteria group bacterium]